MKNFNSTNEALQAIGTRRESERPRDECGVAGVHGHSEAAKIAYLALYALQHRGQESAGICSAHAGECRPYPTAIFGSEILECCKSRSLKYNISLEEQYFNFL